ncbi:N-carbamoylputrescine amidase [Defluviimonas sp. WL0002]|uniref:N-carbamoylputrescine amidase n=1 Tax=Albidovulum marisflavi TaxID=2984159 RepID=A0ABT2ZBN8_9RHOB|nr:N-carbamoylputrescine amidase [Defluviimonas sp. WL0002]MCV2868488.1 N-carbamoylputrescine amidase [Defluviimonas sp. WL0002]
MTVVTLAATQMACSWDADETLDRAEALVMRAADAGAQIILLQELFQAPYFCLEIAERHLDLARTLSEDRGVAHFRDLARRLGVVLPISFFERAGLAHYNTLAMIDADGEILGTYRKTHIPQSAGYEEKFYFTPGDTGFKVFQTRFARVGCGICWDQWFPETARSLALLGAEVFLFPTAIGSEPHFPELDSAAHWQRVMQGHAAANIMPLVASNRIGTERDGQTSVTFYGSSFIADQTGAKVSEAGRDQEAVITATFDLAAIERQRRFWGVFRDRRPDMYGAIATIDGVSRVVG